MKRKKPFLAHLSRFYAKLWPTILADFSNFETEQRGHYERVFSLEESLESLNKISEFSRMVKVQSSFCFPQSGGSLESLNSLEFPENGLFLSEKTPFPKDPFFPNPTI